MTAFFITGTDTEIGKTFVTCTLLHAARAEEDAAFDRYRAIAEVTPWYMSSSARGLLGSVGPSAEGGQA